MQNHLIATRGMVATVHSVETTWRCVNLPQVHVTGQSSESTPGTNNLGRGEQLCDGINLMISKHRRLIEPGKRLTLIERKQVDASHWRSIHQLANFRGRTCQQDGTFDQRQARKPLSQRRPDPARLASQLFGFLFGPSKMFLSPCSRPVLDFDHPHALRTNQHNVNFV
jgi:hypothetical protein